MYVEGGTIREDARDALVGCCIIGAVMEASEQLCDSDWHSLDLEPAGFKIVEVLRDKYISPWSHPETWNDREETTKEDVVSVLREAALR